MFSLNPDLNETTCLNGKRVQKSFFDEQKNKFILDIFINETVYIFTIVEFEIYVKNVLKGQETIYITNKNFNDSIKTYYSISDIDDICLSTLQSKFYRIRVEDSLNGNLSLESFSEFFIVDLNIYYVSCPKNSSIIKISKGWMCQADTKMISRAYPEAEGVCFLPCPLYCKSCSEDTITGCDTCAEGYHRNSIHENCIHQSQGIFLDIFLMIFKSNFFFSLLINKQFN